MSKMKNYMESMNEYYDEASEEDLLPGINVAFLDFIVDSKFQTEQEIFAFLKNIKQIESN